LENPGGCTVTRVITSDVVQAYLHCKYKGHLKLAKEQGPTADYELLLKEQEEGVRGTAVDMLVARHPGAIADRGIPLVLVELKNRASLILDVTLAEDGLALTFDGLERVEGVSKLGDFHYIPILYFGSERIRQAQRDLLGLYGLILGDIQGRQPGSGLIVCGTAARVTRVNLPSGTRRMRQLLKELHELRQSQVAPRLTLNDHCPLCEFRERCHAKAATDDDLSLLRGLSEHEIRRQNSKGIFTVTQLSYTFRPRRRNKRETARSFPHFFALQALAVRENKVYVRGPLSLPSRTTSIYLDIEGVPDRGFHYLASIVVVENGNETQYSYWADRETDEVPMFSRVLDQLGRYSEYVLFHFGSYETRALKQIKHRLPEHRQQLVEQVLSRAVNVLTLIYAHVYFPAYSNSLKDIGRVLGHRWSEADASGAQSVLWRMRWERNRDESLKAKLLRYNTEDCLALKTLVDFLARIVDENSGQGTGGESGPPTASVQDLPMAADRRQQFKQVPVLPGFEFLIKCAYFDYQRQRVFIRTNGKLKTIHKQSRRNTRLSQRVNKSVELPLNRCPGCGTMRIRALQENTRKVIDLKYSSAGVRKCIVKYLSWRYLCEKCYATFVPEAFPRARNKYGRGLASWCIYQNVACGQNMLQVRKTLSEVFQLPLGSQQFYRFKTAVADYFRPAYDRILTQILKGNLLHADETDVDLRRRKGHVWVLANMEWVYFFYRDSREASFLTEMLKSFSGVLVSDFFTGYDSLPCSQQKCLIHLLRDLNEDVFRNPFDEELMKLAQAFAALLRKVVKTVDHHGLQSKHLRRHRAEVEAFFAEACNGELQSDLARGYQKRFEKYQDRLFTFLDHDGVPWNNNNAEHAIHYFARYRTVADGRFTEASIQDYLVLLSLYQSCEYQGINFLHYLRSEIVAGREAFGPGTRKSVGEQIAASTCTSSAVEQEMRPKAEDTMGQAEPGGFGANDCFPSGNDHDWTAR
jgi:predicted RecB family nuclease